MQFNYFPRHISIQTNTNKLRIKQNSQTKVKFDKFINIITSNKLSVHKHKTHLKSLKMFSLSKQEANMLKNKQIHLGLVSK